MLTVESLVSECGLKLSVPGESAKRAIRWVHISELEDPTPWLSGGELLLTTGLQLGDAAQQRAYVLRLVQHGLSGLGFGVGFSHARAPEARAPVDSAPLFAIAARAWRAGAALADGLAGTVTTVAAIAPGRYNLLASDGASLAATTWGDSLFTREAGDAVLIASEPYDDDPSWTRVPDRSLVEAAPGRGVLVRPL